MQISKPWNSHAGLAPEASNKTQFKFWTEAWFEVCTIHPTNRLLKWLLKSNLLIHSWEERLTCFDSNWQMKLTSNASRAACRIRACSMEKQTVARSGFSLVWRRRNQLLAGYFTGDSGICFYFSKKMGQSGDGKRGVTLGWPRRKLIRRPNVTCHSETGVSFHTLPIL